MTTRTMLFAVAAMGLWLASIIPSQAHVVVTENPDSLQGGITYDFLVDVTHAGSTGTWQGQVGAKSWNEPGNPVGSKGWTHTSDWSALNLHEAGWFTITLEQTSGSQLTPAFTLFQGVASGPVVWNPSDPTSGNFEWHTFNTTGNPYDTDPLHWEWARNQISYLDHEANPLSLTAITRTFFLDAGQYSLAFGGNPADTTLTGQHGYLATASLSAVPIPAAVWLFGSGLAGLVGLARRRMRA
jgi:hypothetical protein